MNQTLLLVVLLSVTFGVCRADDNASKHKDPKGKTTKGPIALFNGKDLKGWKVASKNDFQRSGKVSIDDGQIVLEAGKPATGIVRADRFPTMNYEVALEAKRLQGNDFFCGMTFPVDKSYCTLVVGGWGGGVTGLSNIDNMSAVENETTDFTEFKNGRWYKIRLRVTETKIEAWIDKKQVVDVKTKDRKLSIWWEQEPMRPFGIATWSTKAALRKMTLTELSPSSEKAARSSREP